MSKWFQADGKTGVDVRCERCNRRWFHLRGDQETGLHKSPRGIVLGVHFVKWMGEAGAAPEEWLDPWKNQTTTVRPQITVDQYAAEVTGYRDSWDGRKLPIFNRQRYKVTCRPRCGREKVVTVERLEELFLAAISEGRADTTL